jgi:hypothetical protein
MTLLWAMQFVPQASVLRAQHLGVYLLVNVARSTLVFADVITRHAWAPPASNGPRELPDTANVPVPAATQVRS